ncbi:hypothetical protein P7K49_022720 [Saguinus oedipus]|uniref:Uncharacterized protein n=1 Tax=Saguinus oedipus TaxID=9490 RepID=A0ABQ9UKD4_SAGOE|nr:hypothetical protein P7K49_022720 [Saguinus oedipus]
MSAEPIGVLYNSGRRVGLWAVGEGPAGIWGPVPISSSGSRAPRGELLSFLLAEPADSSPSGASAPSQPIAVTLEDLGLLAGGLASPEPLSLEELSERYESSHPISTASVPEQDTAKRWSQLEQWVVELQTEVAHLREHKRRCERATRSLLGVLLPARARLELQGSELRQLWQDAWPAAQAPEKEAPETGESHGRWLQGPLSRTLAPRGCSARPGLSGAASLCARLVEVREALSQLRRRQAQLEAERKGAEQEAGLSKPEGHPHSVLRVLESLRPPRTLRGEETRTSPALLLWAGAVHLLRGRPAGQPHPGATTADVSRLAKLTDLLRREEEGREVACSALRKDQEDSSRRVDLEVARMEGANGGLGGGEASWEVLSLWLAKGLCRLPLECVRCRDRAGHGGGWAALVADAKRVWTSRERGLHTLFKPVPGWCLDTGCSCVLAFFRRRVWQAPLCWAGGRQGTPTLLETTGRSGTGRVSGRGCPRDNVPLLQAQVTRLGEEVSLRFLKREAKLCSFLQKSFLALEKVGARLWPACPAPPSQRQT